MLRKKPSPTGPVSSQRQLLVLYERRKAIDTLIRSLQQYDRFRAKPIDLGKRNSA
jgi:hypothetical protein